ncbi:MAG: T9SS type A sorting domain-containing protein [Flavisolibacter sp.]
MKQVHLLLGFIVAAVMVSACRGKERTAENKLFFAEQKTQPGFKVYSDPKSKRVTIIYVSAVAGKGMVSVYNADGSLVDRKEVVVKVGKNSWDYDIPRISAGIYLVSLKTAVEERTEKVFKSAY